MPIEESWCSMSSWKEKKFYLDPHEAMGTEAVTAGTTCTCCPRARRCTSSRPWSCCTTWRSSCSGTTPATTTTSSGESSHAGSCHACDAAWAEGRQQWGVTKEKKIGSTSSCCVWGASYPAVQETPCEFSVLRTHNLNQRCHQNQLF